MPQNKTAIQIAIEKVQIQIDVLKGVEQDADHAPAVLRFLNNELQFLQSLLPVEREAILEAYRDGRHDEDYYPNRKPQDYFTQTYGI